jgi:hypothetical protein
LHPVFDYSVMPLFLRDLAPLVGKDEDTLARWCERGGVIPGAYRTRGGAKRRGKWRVTVPRPHAEDIETARARSRIDRIEPALYLAILTIDRLCNRIADNARKFARDRSQNERAEGRARFIAELAEEDRRRGLRVVPIDTMRMLREAAVEAIEAVFIHYESPRGFFPALERQVEGRPPLPIPDDRGICKETAADPLKGYAIALAEDMRQRGETESLTVEGIAASLGYSRGDLARVPGLRSSIGGALRSARSYAATQGLDPINIDAPEQRSLLEAPRASNDRNEEQERLIAQWFATMPPEERARAEALPGMPRTIKEVMKTAEKRKRRAVTSFS